MGQARRPTLQPKLRRYGPWSRYAPPGRPYQGSALAHTRGIEPALDPRRDNREACTSPPRRAKYATHRFERCCTPSPPAPDDGDACPRAVWRRVVMVLSHSLAPRKGIPTRAMRLSGAPFCQICAVGPKAAPAQGKARRAQTHLVRGDVPKRLGPVLLHPWRGRVLLGRACTLGRRRRGLCHACHADGQMLRRAPRPRVAARPVQPHSPCLMVRALEAYYRARKAASRAGAGALQAVPVPSSGI